MWHQFSTICIPSFLFVYILFGIFKSIHHISNISFSVKFSLQKRKLEIITGHDSVTAAELYQERTEVLTE